MSPLPHRPKRQLREIVPLTWSKIISRNTSSGCKRQVQPPSRFSQPHSLESARTTRKGTRRLSPTPAKIAAGGDTEGANVGDPAGVPSEGEFNLEDRTNGGALLRPREASRNEGAEDELQSRGS